MNSHFRIFPDDFMNQIFQSAIDEETSLAAIDASLVYHLSAVQNEKVFVVQKMHKGSGMTTVGSC